MQNQDIRKLSICPDAVNLAHVLTELQLAKFISYNSCYYKWSIMLSIYSLKRRGFPSQNDLCCSVSSKENQFLSLYLWLCYGLSLHLQTLQHSRGYCRTKHFVLILEGVFTTVSFLFILVAHTRFSAKFHLKSLHFLHSDTISIVWTKTSKDGMIRTSSSKKYISDYIKC